MMLVSYHSVRAGSELTLNSIVEKLPQHNNVGNQAKLVAHQKLRPDSPPEEGKVRRMPGVGVHASCDELMVDLLDHLRRVIEVGARRCHGQTPRGLSENDKEKAERDRHSIAVLGLKARKSKCGDNDLEHSACMGDIIGGTVGE